MGATLTTVLQRKLGGYEYRVSQNRKWEVMSTEFRKTGRCQVVHSVLLTAGQRHQITFLSRLYDTPLFSNRMSFNALGI